MWSSWTGYAGPGWSVLFGTEGTGEMASLGPVMFRIAPRGYLGPIIVYTTLTIPSVMLLEAFLSFLGLGIQPPNPSWGGTLADGRAYITLYPHISIMPGIMIFLTVLAFNLLGDGLRDVLDPRARK